MNWICIINELFVNVYLPCVLFYELRISNVSMENFHNAHKSNLIFDKNNDNKYHYTIENILLLILICNK